LTHFDLPDLLVVVVLLTKTNLQGFELESGNALKEEENSYNYVTDKNNY